MKNKKLTATEMNGEAYIIVPQEISELHIIRTREGGYSQEIRITLEAK